MDLQNGHPYVQWDISLKAGNAGPLLQRLHFGVSMPSKRRPDLSLVRLATTPYLTVSQVRPQPKHYPANPIVVHRTDGEWQTILGHKVSEGLLPSQMTEKDFMIMNCFKMQVLVVCYTTTYKHICLSQQLTEQVTVNKATKDLNTTVIDIA